MHQTHHRHSVSSQHHHQVPICLEMQDLSVLLREILSLLTLLWCLVPLVTLRKLLQLQSSTLPHFYCAFAPSLGLSDVDIVVQP